MDEDALNQAIREQDGLVSRRQVLLWGGDDDLIERQVRRRRWARVSRGVFVDHTGPLSWQQRARAAVLYYGSAALCHQSALHAHLGTEGPPAEPIHVAVDDSRRLLVLDGVRLHRVTGMAARVQPSRSPARVTFEHAVLDVASQARDDAAAIAVLADACQSRRTTARRLVEVLATRRRLPRRRLLLRVLQDVAEGAYSVLEHRYLVRVERPHGLPTARRQRRVARGRSPAFRDVDYKALGTVVELDGRLGHDRQADRWDDLDRDIASVVAGDVTLRVGWRQVLEPCRLAVAVGRVLQARGWSGTPMPCGPGCPIEPG